MEARVALTLKNMSGDTQDLKAQDPTENKSLSHSSMLRPRLHRRSGPVARSALAKFLVGKVLVGKERKAPSRPVDRGPTAQGLVNDVNSRLNRNAVGSSAVRH
ncbi:hypothetical protein C8J57DRAFT_1235619 [Mycena rebaudengoi]|nr:hypothetical protein C8J57DRAFT_1235619 [Mycena rebaudengoi]